MFSRRDGAWRRWVHSSDRASNQNCAVRLSTASSSLSSTKRRKPRSPDWRPPIGRHSSRAVVGCDAFGGFSGVRRPAAASACAATTRSPARAATSGGCACGLGCGRAWYGLVTLIGLSSSWRRPGASLPHRLLFARDAEAAKLISADSRCQATRPLLTRSDRYPPAIRAGWLWMVCEDMP
jgi:hypothetical protein